MKRSNFIQPPDSVYHTFNEVGKFNIIWNVSIVLVPVFFILMVAHIVFHDNSWITSLSVAILALFNLLYMYRTRRYKVIGTVAVILGTAIVQVSIWFMDDSRLIPDTMWCVMVGFFAYFVFDRLWGTVALMLNLSGLMLFLNYGHAEIIAKKGSEVMNGDYKMIFNVFYVAVALAFIISKIIKDNNEVKEKYDAEIKRNEILLKEIHHRVKNNLQIISSLLSLQASEMEDPSVRNKFNEAIQRIQAMAVIHERMYQRNDLAALDFNDYIVTLASDIISAISTSTNIEVNVDANIGSLELKDLVPLSLIFNELITNSVKHGFEGRTNGSISIQASEMNGQITILYHDNGSWKKRSRDKGFGVELIDALTDQLDGSYTRETEKGTTYVFHFKRNPKK